MQIDWLTVTAQIVNFLFLVWLLQHFLYGPITRAMAAREQRITDRLDDAEKARQEAESEARAFRERQAELERERDRRIAEAEEQAAMRRRELEEEARADIEAERRDWRERLDADRRSFLDDLRRHASEQFFALARHALDDLADAPLEAQMARGFARRLRELDAPARERLAAAAGERVVVKGRFPLDADARREVTRAVHDVLGGEVRLDYAEATDAAVGVEMVAGSQRVAWTLAGYLDDLEDAVAERLRTAPDLVAGAQA